MGPFVQPAPLIERGLRRLYRAMTGRRYIKWDLYTLFRVSLAVNRVSREYQPDVVFSIFPAPLAFYRGSAPCIFVTDLTFEAWQEHGAGFGEAALKLLVWLERRAVERSARVIVHSAWGRDEIVRRHGADPAKIELLVMPSALPAEAVPAQLDGRVAKTLSSPLQLLLVGRDYYRKGVDVAIEIMRQLNAQGTPAELTVCGTRGVEEPHLRFVGPYRKSDPAQLEHYAALYRQAHLLLHPARFEPAGIVPSEAAAFGTPTITNDTGGLATTVKDGVSGIVLPKASPPRAYVQAILDLVHNPSRYYELCASTRRRYEQELNWEVAGKQVATILKEVVEGSR